MKKKIVQTVVVILCCILAGCGNKTALSEFDPFVPGILPAPVRYVPINSPWTGAAVGGFNHPTDIIAGYDNTIYVIDSGNNRIVQLDEAGNVMATSQPIANMKAIAQRRNMELLVTANANSLAAVYALNLAAVNGRLHDAVPRIVHQQPVLRPTDIFPDFTAIATVEDNAFYVASTGGPDTLSKFSSRNQFQESVVIQPSPPTVGAYPIEATYLNGISAIAPVTQPPQNLASGSGIDFFFVCDAPDVLHKIRWVRFASGFSAQGIFFANTRNLPLIEPADITYDPERQQLFIVDASTNTLHQLNTRLGIEGISGVRALDQPFFVNVDFTSFGTSGDKLSAPQGVCYLNRTLYISDTGNNRILRFKLTYDIEGIPVP